MPRADVESTMGTIKIRLSVKDILFEDENYIAVNKKAAWSPSNLLHALKSYIKQRDKLNAPPYLDPFQALEGDASGVNVFVKTKLVIQKCTRVYQAICAKNFEQNFKRITSNKTHSIVELKQIPVNFKYQAIHCCKVEFLEPLNGRVISINCPTPFTLENFSEQKKSKIQTILFHKPYNVLCQFTKQTEAEVCLSDFNLPKDIYPAGRLDKDSEGLLLLTNDGDLINKMANPKFEKEKTYLAQVENIPSKESLIKLSKGVLIENYKTKPCKVRIIEDANLPAIIGPRNPPIRQRASIPTCWLEIKITEGKNRQVRKMTAHINHPTLRLVRIAIGDYKLNSLNQGEFIIVA